MRYGLDVASTFLTMDMKLCRICGKQDDNYVHIFKTEGLKNKIETCLPIVISNQSLLPDTICNSCLDSIDNFYSFIKNCLQNIIVLEAQYEIIESCLKTKRKVDKSVCASDSDFDCDVTKDKLNGNDYVQPCLNFSFSDTTLLSTPKVDSPIPNFSCSLVDYDSSDDNSDNEEVDDKNEQKTDEIKIRSSCKGTDEDKNTQSSGQSDIINEIAQRKFLKRKIEDVIPNIFKSARMESESSSRRKNKQPKKVEYHLGTKIETAIAPIIHSYASTSDEPAANSKLLVDATTLGVPEALQACLLCEQQFYGPVLLTAHMYETHGIDLAQVFAAAQPQQPLPKKKIPELVKISDVLSARKQLPPDNYDEPPVLEPQTPLPSPTMSSLHKNLQCTECNNGTVYATFKEFSSHRRSQHQIFHCDLCPKFYGRNSHLWKHVNRVHKGHPSITCRLCHKTSASKYHLAQHFTKMHSIKTASKVRSESPPTLSAEDDTSDFMAQKFQGFDFQSVRQSFLRQDMLEKEKLENDDSSSIKSTDIKKETSSENVDPVKLVQNYDVKTAPKEIDSSSNLYTNIITNYTPPTNEGAFKCPKCFKSFYKKNLLKKHKKNCRPRLQKDLLTRCKTCSRIFKDRQSLTKHLINYHSEYTCEICNLAVQSKCEIVSHIRFSHPNCELVCYCGQILRSKGDLQKHKMDHKESHVCQFCGDALPTKIKLKMHILSLHRKILSLSCGICLKLFETQHILRDHVRLVHGDQLSPLTSCTVCGKNYGSKWKTYDHLNKSHGRIFKACKACLEVFETELDLQAHFEKTHLNAKNCEKKPAQADKKVELPVKENEHLNEDDNSTSDSEDDATSEDSTGHSSKKTLQEDLEYRNFIIREFQSNMESKKPDHNGLGYPVKTEQQTSPESQLSLLEKRLLGKKITHEDLKSLQKEHKKSKNNVILENGSKDKKKSKPERYDEDPTQNSSKRTVYVNSNDPSLCEICLKVWPAKKHLWQHYIRCHKETAATVCGICLKTNPSYSSLQTHLRETHPNLLHGCGFGSNFICKICGRYHNASSKLKLHMAIHVGFNDNMLLVSDNKTSKTDDNAAPEIKNEVVHDMEEQILDDLDVVKIEIKEELIEPDEINYENMIEEVEVYSDSEGEYNDHNEVDFIVDNAPTYNNENNEVESNNEDNEAESNNEDDEVESNNEEQSNNEAEYNNEDNVLSVTSKQSEIYLTSSDEEPSDNENDDSENEVTENELEQEMLKNMLGENVIVTKQELVIEDSSNDALSLNSNSNNVEVESCDVKMEIGSSDEWTDSPNQTKELDNAVRSISYDTEMEVVCLTESELETAVGSIL